MVHDSYGIHACNVDLLNRVLREEFVRIIADFAGGKSRRTLPPLPIHPCIHALLCRHQMTGKVATKTIP